MTAAGARCLAIWHRQRRRQTYVWGHAVNCEGFRYSVSNSKSKITESRFRGRLLLFTSPRHCSPQWNWASF